MNNDLNCLSHWFPLIEAAGLPVPKTEIVRAPGKLYALLDGKEPAGWRPFLAELTAAADRIGWPVFLRTGQGAGKHDWANTCCVPTAADLPAHVAALVEWSECAGFLGLPHSVWAVREMLPTVPQFTAFRGMPICREFRFFVREGKFQCEHPYWPKEALEEGFYQGQPAGWPKRYESLCRLDSIDALRLYHMAERAGAALGGYWSVDLLETRRGWYVTDLALGTDSFHWPECPHAPKRVI